MVKNIKEIVYVIVAVILVNVLSSLLFFRWDFTSNKRYSLSKVSKNIIRENTEPVRVDLYLTEDLPQEIRKIVKEFKSLLKEYKSISRTEFTINTIHLNTQEKELEATKTGISPVYHEIRERDLEKIQRLFIGAVFQIGDRRIVIPEISSDTPLEYMVTRLFKQQSDTLKPVIGFVRGHGETRFKQMPQLIHELSQLTKVHVISRIYKEELDGCNVLCIIDPKESYTSHELELLDRYLANGGRMFIALNHAIGQVGDRNSGFINPTGIEDLLEEKGLKIKYDFVVDNNCGTIAINQQYGFVNFQSNISFPYIPLITNFSDHTITYGLKSMLLPFASSIEQVKTSSAYIFTPLAETSSISGIQQAPVFFDYQKQWRSEDFSHPRNTVAALLTNDDNNSAIVAITDANFIEDNIVSSTSTDNVNFAINSIEWLADNTGLIQLRNKFTTFSYLEPQNENTKQFIKYLNFLLPIILILTAGLIHYRNRMRRRNNRSHHGYID